MVSSKIDKLICEVEGISIALKGDYKTKGFISKVESKFEDVYFKINEINLKIADIQLHQVERNKFVSSIALKLLVGILTMVVTGGIFAYVRFM